MKKKNDLDSHLLCGLLGKQIITGGGVSGSLLDLIVGGLTTPGGGKLWQDEHHDLWNAQLQHFQPVSVKASSHTLSCVNVFKHDQFCYQNLIVLSEKV